MRTIHKSDRAIRLRQDLEAIEALAVAMRDEDLLSEALDAEVEEGEEEDDGRASQHITLAALIQSLRAKLRADATYDGEVADVSFINYFVARTYRSARTLIRVTRTPLTGPFDVGDYLLPPRRNAACDAMRQDLDFQRKLLAKAISARDVQSVNRIAKLIYAGEKQLFHSQCDAKILLTKEEAAALIVEAMSRMDTRPDVVAARETAWQNPRLSRRIDQMTDLVDVDKRR